MDVGINVLKPSPRLIMYCNTFVADLFDYTIGKVAALSAALSVDARVRPAMMSFPLDTNSTPLVVKTCPVESTKTRHGMLLTPKVSPKSFLRLVSENGTAFQGM